MNKIKFYSFHNREYLTHPKKSTLHLLSKLYMPFNMLNDRFNLLNDSCEYNLLSRNEDINVIWNRKYKSFEECCFDRVNEIISYSEFYNIDIYVSYSGGVDSTCVVCSFLMNERLDKNHFHILYNKNSVDEYPYFFNFLIKNGISLIDIKFDIQNLINISKDGIIVSGLCGDQLDGSNLLTKRFYNKIDYFDNWKDALTICSSIKVSEEHMSELERYINYTGLNIKYFGEFAWLFSFCVKWTYVSEYMNVLTKNKYYPFFDTLDFSRYALYNLSKDYKRKQQSVFYKSDFKKLIYKYTKDENYLLYKGKDANYIGSKEASPSLMLSSADNIISIQNASKETIYNIILPFIKPAYKDYFIVEE